MDKTLLRISLFLTAFVVALLLPSAAWADEEADTLYVVFRDGRLDAFPRQMVVDVDRQDAQLVVTVQGGYSFRYDIGEIEAYDQPVQLALPSITSFKFNNKFNHQVFADAEFEIDGDSVIQGEVGAIGRWLTPSFQLSDPRAVVFRDDTLRLHSKVTRTPFRDQHTLTCTYPGLRVLKHVLVREGHKEESEYATRLFLTADMLSTNAPSNYDENPDKLLDNDLETFFHSTWGSGPYQKLPADSCPYLDVHLPEAMHSLQFSYILRAINDRYTTALRLYASHDGERWVTIRDFTLEEDQLPTTPNGYYHSPTVNLGDDYAYLRFEQLSSIYHNNYIMWAEFSIWSVSSIIYDEVPDEYAYQFVPLGRRYRFGMDWLADHATTTPSVYIDTDEGYPPYTKDYYVDAYIRFDGAGVFPSMDNTIVQIKGRGNSSWNSNAWTKNPYRLRFLEKVKPFGLTKGKSWVLQSNRQKGSMLANPIGMYAAGLAGADGTNHYVPVELYMNGEYWGSYTFTEKVGFHNNSIDLDDDSRACLLELDTYTDETIYRSSPGNLPVKVKEPDFSDPTSTTVLTSTTEIMSRFNAFTKLVNEGKDISPEVDVESLARFLMVTELIGNNEIKHPKSTYLYHEDVLSPDARFKWGPVWDLDWAFGYEGSNTYYQQFATSNFWTSNSNMAAYAFMRKLRQAGEPLDRAIYREWTLFMRDHLEDLIDYCKSYYDYARPSLENNNNATHGSDKDNTNYATNAVNAQRWLRQRANYVYAQLTPYELTDEELQQLPEDQLLDDYSDIVVGTQLADQNDAPTRFDVYDLRGVRLKAGAAYDNFRQGLRPGIYIVNGKKVLIP